MVYFRGGEEPKGILCPTGRRLQATTCRHGEREAQPHPGERHYQTKHRYSARCGQCAF